MKRSIITIVALVLAIVLALPAFSATLGAISTPIVTVQLTKRTIITQQQLDEKMELYRQTYGDSITEEDVLKAMISDEVLSQAMARDGFVLSDEQKDELLATYKQNIELQVGQSLTDEEFDQVLQYQLGVDIATFREYVAEQYTVQAYVYNKKGDMLSGESVAPSDAEVEAFYRKNKSSFIMPEKVKLSHIYFTFGEDVTASMQKAADVLEQIKSGKITFEKAVSQYSEDQSSKDSAGEIGWLLINDEDTLNRMGENFFDAVFALDAGEISNVIVSYAGYHIVKVTVHDYAKFLALDDKLSPDDSTTVRDYISEYLASQYNEALYTKAFQSLLEDLMDSALIKYLN